MNIFSKIQVQRFVQEGFIVKHHFFDASEVEIMQKETNRLLEEGTFRNVSIDEDAKLALEDGAPLLTRSNP